MNFLTRLTSTLTKLPLTRTFATKPPPGRVKIVLKDEELIETFVKGSGPGGQCINKRSSCVDLRHIPTGIRVQCQQSRSLADNRGIARKLLREKLDEHINGKLSKNSQKAAKIAKQKAKRAKRAKEKYAKPSTTDPEADVLPTPATTNTIQPPPPSQSSSPTGTN